MNNKKGDKSLRNYLTSPQLILLAYFTAFPLILFREFWLRMWRAGASRAWDGSVHYAIAAIYNQSIFPDTFGWTRMYFDGMPFPNFYPPVFYWCVALLTHTHLFTFDTAFKLMTALPLVLMPAIVWMLAWRTSDKDWYVATWATFGSLILIIDPRSNGSTIWPSGLDYHSTYVIGLYTQPLGFALLLVWFMVYLRAHRGRWHFFFAALLLALTVLTNFFNAVVSTVMVACVLGVDLARYFVRGAKARSEVRRELIAHLLTPLIAFGLALFWIVPMVANYRYFVTIPFNILPLTPFLWGWYVISIIGVIGWLRRPTRAMWPFLTICLIVALTIIFPMTISPNWFPFQTHRFLSMLNFLLAVPVGHALVSIYRVIAYLPYRKFKGLPPRLERYQPYALGIFLTLFGLLGYWYTTTSLAKAYIQLFNANSFYPSDKMIAEFDAAPPVRRQADVPHADRISEESTANLGIDAVEAARALNSVLRFGQEHRDGSYLVTFGAFRTHDARAMIHYLGAQGNQVVLCIFREASANAIFMFPQVNALSNPPENFGMSSVLGDDVEFAEQPLSKHLERLRSLGVRYLITPDDKLKNSLAQEPGLGARTDFGDWSIVDLQNVLPPIRALAYRPALILSDFTLKRRQRHEPNFVRFAEEQFSENWFDVLLAYSPKNKIEAFKDEHELLQFGAIILDRYDCDDCDLAYRRLHEFAQQRRLILLKRDSPLFQRIAAGLVDFPNARVIDRPLGNSGEWIQNINEERTFRYSLSPIRKQWEEIRAELESSKVPVSQAQVGGEITQNRIQLNYSETAAADKSLGVPVLVRSTFYPEWRRDDGGELYLATPAYTLTFIHGSASIKYQRSLLDKVGLAVSGLVLIGLLGLTIRRRRQPPGTEETDSLD